MFTRAGLYDTIYGSKNYRAEAVRTVAFIDASSTAVRPRTLLDVACGTGKHAEYLREGFQLEGLDLDAALLEIARKRCPGIPFHEGDMRSFKLDRRINAITCLFSSIGYMTTPADLQAAVENMAHHLAPGGVLVVEPFLHPSDFVEGYVAGTTVDRPDLKISRYSISRRDGRICTWDFHYLVATPGGIEHFTELHRLGLFSREEYEEALNQSGLDVRYDPIGVSGRGAFVGTRSM